MSMSLEDALKPVMPVFLTSQQGVPCGEAFCVTLAASPAIVADETPTVVKSSISVGSLASNSGLSSPNSFSTIS